MSVPEQRSHYHALDHGYVEEIETWGSDERIVESARMSTGRGFVTWGPIDCICVNSVDGIGKMWISIEGGAKLVTCSKCKGTGKAQGDEKLLRTLFTNGHTTPFEQAGMTIEVQAPLFIFREWHRHRTQSYNEFSARYSPMPDVNYIPTVKRLQMMNEHNKQAQGIKPGVYVSNAIAENFISDLEELQNKIEHIYQQALKDGIPKELARLVIPVSRYSKMRASANLLNWIRFLRLRLHHTAQYEIREYAMMVELLLMDRFPRTMKLFSEEQDARTEKERQDEEIRRAKAKGEII